MAANNETDAEDLDRPTTYNYNDIYQLVVDQTDGPIESGQGQTNYGTTSQAHRNEGPSSGVGAQSQLNNNLLHEEPGSWLKGNLILAKELKSPFDIRCKSNYFPRSGKSVGKPQTLRCLRTVDGDDEIIIKFPDGYKIPTNPDDYYLEICLLTVSQLNQYHKHANKFQLSHTDVNVPDVNPFLIPLTNEHFKKGEVRTKLVLIKTLQRELEAIKSLPLFDERIILDNPKECNSVKDLKETYALHRATIAFSLVHRDSEGKFVRLLNRSIVSNEIIENEESEEANTVTCPYCSCCFDFKEEKKKAKKRSAPSSNASNKKRSTEQ